MKNIQLQDSSYQELILGALLHDIGKFAERAERKELKDLNESLYCPYDSQKRCFIQQHSCYTVGFLQKFKTVLPEGVNYADVQKIAGSHHLQNLEDERSLLVQQADILSLGSDGTGIIEPNGRDQHKRMAMRSIFASLRIDDKDAVQGSSFAYPLNQLATDSLIPEENVRLGPKGYNELWERFIDDFQQLAGMSFKRFLNALISLMEQYLWCIPSSTLSDGDSEVSLFDHSIITAGIAAVLYQYSKDKRENDKIPEPEKSFIFISGDVSGIQHYIFDLPTAKYNAKILRSRSFEVQVAIEDVADTLLDRCELPSCCKLMSSGGRFIVFMPNTDRVLSLIRSERERIERYFYDRYLGKLSMNISEPLAVDAAMLKKDHAEKLFNMISEKTLLAKNRRFSTVLTDPDRFLFSHMYDEMQKSGVCDICRSRSVSGIKDDICVCENCAAHIDMGQKLPKAEGVVFDENEGILQLPSGRKINIENRPSPSGEKYMIHSFDAGKPLMCLPYTVPLNSNNQVLTFEEIASYGDPVGYENSQGKLAMLKMDVDNLGRLFSDGMKDTVSLSRYATFSRMMHQFFSTMVHDLIEDDERYRFIYTVFSGGDDLCVIGPWKDVIDFSESVHDLFNQFVGYNDQVTISAGISFAKPHVTVRTFAHNAEEALEASKDYVCPDSSRKKHAVTLFETTIPWRDYPKVKDSVSQLIKMHANGLVSVGTLYRLLEYHKRFKGLLKGGDLSPYNASWESHLRYDAARNIDQEQERIRFLGLIIGNMKYMRAIASLVLYTIREGMSKEE